MVQSFLSDVGEAFVSHNRLSVGFVRAQFGSPWEGIKNQLTDEATCVNIPACSSLALLLLLSRWGTLMPQLGGMQLEQCKKRCEELLTTLVGAAAALGDSFEVSVQLCQRWICRWPRPDRVEGDVFAMELPVRAGFINLSGLLAPKHHPRSLLKTISQVLLATFGTQVEAVPLIRFIWALTPNKVMWPLLAQLCLCLALRLERHVAFVSRMMKTDDQVVASFAWHGAASAQGLKQDLHVQRYLMACTDRLKSESIFSSRRTKVRCADFLCRTLWLAFRRTSWCWHLRRLSIVNVGARVLGFIVQFLGREGSGISSPETSPARHGA